MPKLEKIKSVMVLALIIVLFSATINICAVAGAKDPFGVIKEKLDGISEEEKEILQNLFTLTQEIELMELAEVELSLEVETINQEIKNLEAAIAAGELSYEKKQDSLKRVLRSYQRMGPGSFLEILLDSDSLSMFLQRINILRDITRNTGELLNQIEEAGERLSREKIGLSEKVVKVKERQEQAKAALAKKLEFKTEKEEYLASLKGDKAHYQEYLSNLEQVWGEIKPLVGETSKEFSRIIQKGELPTGALKLSFSLLSIKGAISDKVINEVLKVQSTLPEMVFTFHPGKVEISLPEKKLVLSGTFALLEGHTLKFQAQEGSFYGMPLEKGAIEEMFSSEDLLLNMEPQLAGNVIDAIEIKEGYMELISNIDLF